MSYKSTLAAVLALALAACGGGDTEAPEAATTNGQAEGAASTALPSISGPDVWQVDYSRSSVGFSAEQEGTPFSGSFANFEATIRLDPDNPQDGMIAALIDLASADAGNSERNDALPTSDWFAVRRHPSAQFMSEDITRTASGYEATGELSMKGVSREVVLPFTLEISGDEATASGEITIDRTNWDIGGSAYDDGEWVSKDVTITVDIVATR